MTTSYEEYLFLILRTMSLYLQLECHHIDLQFVRLCPSLKEPTDLVLLDQMICTCGIDNEIKENLEQKDYKQTLVK